MSIAEAEARARQAAEQRAAAWRAELRAKLDMLCRAGATVLLDLGPQRGKVLARIVSIGPDEMEILDLGDARVWPKPTRTIGIDAIAGAEVA